MRLLAAAVWAVARCLHAPPDHQVLCYVQEVNERAFLDACARICSISGIAFDIGRHHVEIHLLDYCATIRSVPLVAPVIMRGRRCDVVLDEFPERQHGELLDEIKETFKPVTEIDTVSRLVLVEGSH